MEETHMNKGKGQSKSFVCYWAPDNAKLSEPKQTCLLAIFIMDWLSNL